MPRGVKGSGPARTIKSIDDRIAENDALISSLQEKLSEAKSKRRELRQIKDKSEFEAIQKIIKKNNISPEQLKDLIESNK